MRRPRRAPFGEAPSPGTWRDRKVPGYWQPEAGRELATHEASVRFVDAAMRHWIAQHPGDDHAARSHPHDVVRLATTIAWLRDLEPRGRRILELGGYGVASFVLEQAFPDNEWMHDETDLRQPLPFPDEHFDLVLAMEVIEHVADPEYAHATRLSGMRHCLRQIHRVLRVHGTLFLTTPNACSLLVLDRALRGEPPWQYPFHFRELTPRELQILVEQAGLHVHRCGTEYVWSRPEETPALVRFLRDEGLDVAERGDDTFLVAERRATPPVPRGTLDLPV